jgi:hypothetical protein
VPGCAALRKQRKTKEQTFDSKRDLTKHLMSPQCHKTGKEVLEAVQVLERPAPEDNKLRREAVDQIMELSFCTSGMQ